MGAGGVAVRLGLQVRPNVTLDLLRPPVAARADCQQHPADSEIFSCATNIPRAAFSCAPHGLDRRSPMDDVHPRGDFVFQTTPKRRQRGHVSQRAGATQHASHAIVQRLARLSMQQAYAVDTAQDVQGRASVCLAAATCFSHKMLAAQPSAQKRSCQRKMAEARVARQTQLTLFQGLRCAPFDHGQIQRLTSTSMPPLCMWCKIFCGAAFVDARCSGTCSKLARKTLNTQWEPTPTLAKPCLARDLIRPEGHRPGACWQLAWSPSSRNDLRPSPNRGPHERQQPPRLSGQRQEQLRWATAPRSHEPRAQHPSTIFVVNAHTGQQVALLV